MTRLLVLVEGETEEMFVNSVLEPHLRTFGYIQVAARLLGNARQRSRRGGIRAWSSARTDLERHLRQDREAILALMVDYYGLPQNGPRAWPGRAASAGADAVEAALRECVTSRMGGGFDRNRFLPLVMMHEFEAMLFSDCEAFGTAIGRPDLVCKLQAIRNEFANPEAIDDSPETAPSKRIGTLFPGYEKPLMGTLAALQIGLDRIRAECPHFRSWLERLEARAASAP
ncbi:MAG: DUF4276 family protein [Alphaproteobacteria bacterium]|nr:DUF4276 family protein [Alphaproteobacteria bacterium]